MSHHHCFRFRFIQVETYFFWMWWHSQKETKKRQVRSIDAKSPMKPRVGEAPLYEKWSTNPNIPCSLWTTDK